jgi:hypothetical protein
VNNGNCATEEVVKLLAATAPDGNGGLRASRQAVRGGLELARPSRATKPRQRLAADDYQISPSTTSSPQCSGPGDREV